MNIFVLDHDIKKAALYHMSKHVVKMPLETAQMLCTTLNKVGVQTPYLPVHRNHPCTLWAGQSRANFLWLCELGVELCVEYTHRYGKVHGSENVIWYCLDNYKSIKDGELTPFAQAMPDEFKNKCAIKAYRDYYKVGKAHIADWGVREKPEWY